MKASQINTPEQEPVGAGGSIQTPIIQECPHCQGEGWFVYVGGPGRFDSRFGNWLPSERAVPCERCGGTGELDPDEDPNPTQANDDDDEDDDALFDGIDLSELPF